MNQRFGTGHIAERSSNLFPTLPPPTQEAVKVPTVALGRPWLCLAHSCIPRGQHRKHQQTEGSQE